MKVKEMERKLIDATTDKEFMELLGSILESLCEEANNNITRFCAKSQEEVIKQIDLVNTKWLDLVNRINKYIWENPFEAKPVNGANLVDNGFKAAFVYINPDKKYILDLDEHEKKMSELKEAERKKKEGLYFHKVTPWEDLNSVDDMRKEFLSCLYSLQSVNSILNGNLKMVKQTATPLVVRCQMLEYFIKKNEKIQSLIDLYDNKEYENVIEIIERG